MSAKLTTLGLRPATLLKKRLWCRCFPLNFAKYITEHLRRLFLQNVNPLVPGVP